jgi:hypothetical protein
MEVVPASDSPSMSSRLEHRIGPLLGLLLFAGALWVLHHQLKAYRFHDVMQSLKSLPGERFFAALALTFLSYLAMTGYDALALRYVRHPLPYRKFGLASFISYAFSNNMGVGMRKLGRPLRGERFPASTTRRKIPFLLLPSPEVVTVEVKKLLRSCQ